MNHVVKQKTILTKFIIMSLDIKQKSIANLSCKTGSKLENSIS